jgi:hypothetical protein
MGYNLRVLFASIWRQGMRSNYRRSYWRFLYRMLSSFYRSPARLWLGFTCLLSAHHFVLYSKVVIKHLVQEIELVEQTAGKPVGSADDELVGVEAAS